MTEKERRKESLKERRENVNEKDKETLPQKQDTGGDMAEHGLQGPG